MVFVKIGHNHAVGPYPDIPGNLDLLKDLRTALTAWKYLLLRAGAFR